MISIRCRRLTLYLLLLSFSACGRQTGSQQQPIEPQAVVRATISHLPFDQDTVVAIRQLTTKQVEQFAAVYNNALLLGLYKYVTRYRIVLWLTDGSVRTFRISGHIIKERSDWCYDLGDSLYADKLWREAEENE